MAVCYEPFLLDEKMLPLLDEVEPPRGAVAVPVPIKSDYSKPLTATPYLMNDLGSVYVELSGNALTPPQSPPCDNPLLTTLEPILARPICAHAELSKPAIYSVPEKQLAPETLPYPLMSIPIEYAQPQQQDIARELAVVDELIRTRVEDMQWSSGPSSPDSSSNSNFDDSSSSEDPEWVPELGEAATASAQMTKLPRKRSKPYSPAASDDKKSRKKEQNKNAATRYRLKKKAEVEEILHEEKQLLGTNTELNAQISDLQREIKYLKGLMRDLLKAKGVIN
ncbi:activating transcription factor of chaperone isoform X2 [Cylas formicarius]|uniref:activating transcription factor of chaperone isoform X2 n=1 Tax=Cylas formicarius TaxID=197179 RepID=UPI0029587EA8|nr:activating transcription factor of chaperone isoform X2 [Cylas formicarius]